MRPGGIETAKEFVDPSRPLVDLVDRLPGLVRQPGGLLGVLRQERAHAVVDGNVFRVLSRYFGISDDISDAKSFKVFEKKANQLLPKNDAANFNQAIMDFGAIQCKPKSPHCALCPLSSSCFAFNQGLIRELPVKSKKVKVKKRYFNYLVISFEEKYLLKARGPKDIWQGLYDFALIESIEAQDTELVLNKLKTDRFELLSTDGPIKHVLTHQQIFARFIALKIEDFDTFERLKEAFGCKAFTAAEIETVPKPILIENYLKDAVFSVD